MYLSTTVSNPKQNISIKRKMRRRKGRALTELTGSTDERQRATVTCS